MGVSRQAEAVRARIIERWQEHTRCSVVSVDAVASECETRERAVCRAVAICGAREGYGFSGCTIKNHDNLTTCPAREQAGSLTRSRSP